MLTTLLKWLFGAAILGSLFWCPTRNCVALLFAFWTVAVAFFVYSNLADRFLWIPVMLALTGVLGSILELAIPANTTLAINVAVLILFAVTLEVLKRKRRSSVVFVRHSA